MPEEIIFRADATPAMGTGHVMRCFALAKTARLLGHQVRLAGRIQVPWVVDRLESEGIPLALLSGNVPAREAPEELFVQMGSPENKRAVLDGYHFGTDCQERLRQSGNSLLVIDDCNHLSRYACDVLLNQNIGTDKFDYNGKIGTRLLGPHYALLRPEFITAAAEAHSRIFSGNAKTLLLTLGGGDFSNHLPEIASRLCMAELAGCKLKIIAGKTPKDAITAGLRDCQAEIEILEQVHDMPELMLWADVCITAGGSTCWELCCLGTPFLVVEIADNQHNNLLELAQRHIAPELSCSSLLALVQSAEERKSASEAGQKLVDGHGAYRVIQAVCGRSFVLRRVVAEDSPAVWELANSPMVRQISITQTPIPLSTHELWFADQLRHNRNFYIIESLGGDFCGYVRFAVHEDMAATVSIAICHERRGKGLGTASLIDAGRLFFKEYPDYTICAAVESDNKASLRMFQKSGFLTNHAIEINGRKFIQLFYVAK